MKKIYLYGNWKMNMSLSSTASFAQDFLQALREEAALTENTEFCVFVPFTLIHKAVQEFRPFAVGAQNVSEYDSGAYTGEVSADMLKELGVNTVIVGHSERRHIYGESSQQVGDKAAKCVENGLVPVICVGETLEERESGKTLEVIREQLDAAVEKLPDKARYLIAYEPVWAIGTGRAASAQDAEEVCAFIKQRVNEPVLYGGSVKPSNSAELFSQPSIDGGLIGGASLVAKDFIAILKNYRNTCV